MGGSARSDACIALISTKVSIQTLTPVRLDHTPHRCQTWCPALERSPSIDFPTFRARGMALAQRYKSAGGACPFPLAHLESPMPCLRSLKRSVCRDVRYSHSSSQSVKKAPLFPNSFDQFGLLLGRLCCNCHQIKSAPIPVKSGQSACASCAFFSRGHMHRLRRSIALARLFFLLNIRQIYRASQIIRQSFLFSHNAPTASRS